MPRLIVAVVRVLLALGSVLVVVAQKEATAPLVLEHAEDPKYPPLARVAHIETRVEVEFRVDSSGRADSVAAVSGHPLLMRAAEDAVRTWRFARPAKGFRTSEVHTTVFEFSLTEEPEGLRPSAPQPVSVHYDSFESVSVSSKWTSVFVDGNCTAAGREPDLPPDPDEIHSADYVELSRSLCFGTCPSYRVRLYRSGQVEWEGRRWVSTLGLAHAMAPQGLADEIFESVLTDEVWSLCSSYSSSASDLATNVVIVNIGDQQKVIEDYAASGPQLLRELIRRIDSVSNTHQWRHGDPAMEPLSNIRSEAWYGKPGITNLMMAAASGEMERVAELLASGTDVDAVDSSGWTALMYGAGSGKDLAPLLKAGANPNHIDLMGRSALMAAAFGYSFDKELHDAGANVNAQSKDGLTTLMVLASQGDPEEIGSALRADADPTLVDSDGRTALDYLLASNCRHDPLYNPSDHFFTIESDQCNAMEPSDFQESLQMLKAAVVRVTIGRR